MFLENNLVLLLVVATAAAFDYFPQDVMDAAPTTGKPTLLPALSLLDEEDEVYNEEPTTTTQPLLFPAYAHSLPRRPLKEPPLKRSSNPATVFHGHPPFLVLSRLLPRRRS